MPGVPCSVISTPCGPIRRDAPMQLRRHSCVQLSQIRWKTICDKDYGWINSMVAGMQG